MVLAPAGRAIDGRANRDYARRAGARHTVFSYLCARLSHHTHAYTKERHGQTYHTLRGPNLALAPADNRTGHTHRYGSGRRRDLRHTRTGSRPRVAPTHSLRHRRALRLPRHRDQDRQHGCVLPAPHPARHTPTDGIVHRVQKPAHARVRRLGQTAIHRA